MFTKHIEGPLGQIEITRQSGGTSGVLRLRNGGMVACKSSGYPPDDRIVEYLEKAVGLGLWSTPEEIERVKRRAAK